MKEQYFLDKTPSIKLLFPPSRRGIGIGENMKKGNRKTWKSSKNK
jgi:hypothetical protein